MKPLYSVYGNSLKAIVTGEYTSYELFPGFSKLVASAILAATEQFDSNLQLRLSDEETLEETLIKIIKKIDDDPRVEDNWFKFDSTVDEAEVLNIIEEWGEDFIESLLMFRFSQDENVLEWVKLLNSFNGEALGELFGLCGMISLNSLEKLLEIATPPISPEYKIIKSFYV